MDEESSREIRVQTCRDSKDIEEENKYRDIVSEMIREHERRMHR